jgi:PIN domain nuclease of toxin-antitoxin system
MTAGYLMDSHSIPWLLNADRKLPREVATAIESARLPAFVSVATIWELEIKQATRRLTLEFDLCERLAHFSFPLLLITPADAVAAARLPLIHRDPFDRMLVAQAHARGLTLVTADATLLHYGIPVLWAAIGA